jgi:hypothetical protein
MTDPSRHLSPEGFASYLRSAAPIEHLIPGEPPLALFVDPQRMRIGLRGPARANEVPAPSRRERVAIQLLHHKGQRMVEIAISDARLFEDAYPILCSVADRVQIDKLSLSDALTRTLRHLGHLLEPEGGLPQDLEISLLGELAILIGAIRAYSPAAGVQAWRGWDREEHDFDLMGCDVEVKTTTSESRHHRISSLTQLVATGDRPLWLISVQVTRAGSGTTIAELIGRVRDLLTDEDARVRFEDQLNAAGWRDRYQQSVVDAWRLRSPITAYQVASSFPRLTPDLLAGTGVRADLIDDVTYRVNLTNRPPDPPPSALAAVIANGEKELS